MESSSTARPGADLPSSGHGGFLSHIGITTWLTIVVFIGTLASVGAVLTWTMHLIKENELHWVQKALDANIQLLKEALSPYGTEWEVEGDKLMLGDTVLNDNFEAVDKVKAALGGVATVFRGDTRVTTNVSKADGSRALGTTLDRNAAYDAIFNKRTSYQGQVSILGVPYLTIYEPIKDNRGQVIGILFVGVPQNEFDEMLADIQNRALKGASLALIVLGGLVIFIVRLVLRPLPRVEAAVESIARGETDIVVPCCQRHDEVGQMARSLERLRKVIAEAFRLRRMVDDMPTPVMFADPAQNYTISYMNGAARQLMGKLAQHLGFALGADGALGQNVTALCQGAETLENALRDPNRLPMSAHVRSGGETIELNAAAIKDPAGRYVGPMLTWTVITQRENLANDFETNVQGVVGVVSTAAQQIQAAAQSMAHAANASEERASSVAAAAGRASSNVQNVAGAAEELAASITEIGHQIVESARKTTVAAEQARATNAQVDSLAEAASRIGDVVKLISGIAGQTNLLALNATIEAARAGDAGKGFAVVANEVKNLANQSAKATDEITAQITSMQEATTGAVKAIRSIVSTIEEVNNITSVITTSMQQQESATSEIARNVQQASSETGEVTSSITEVQKSTSEAGASASQLLGASRDLGREADRLRSEVARFVKSVRTT